MELLDRLDLSFILLISICWYVLWRSKRIHHGDWLNPLAATVFLTIGVYTILSYLSVLQFTDPDEGATGSFGRVLRISSVYLVSIYIGYAMRRNPLRALILKPLSVYTLWGRPGTGARMTPAIVLGCAAVSYVGLMVSSGVGLLWITDTRSAYQFHRSGSGHWWLLYQWLVIAALFLTLSSRRESVQRPVPILAITLFYAALLYFSGSKGAVLSVFIAAGLYWHFYVRSISGPKALLGVSFIVLFFLAQLVLTGTYQDLAAAGAYFVDYFYFAAEFIDRIDEIGYRLGEGWLTSLWFYVPRSIYPDKPIEYGLLLIHQILFPGMAQEGTTPGIVGWSLSYLDFGYIGVAIEGFLTGSFQRAVYTSFLRRRSIGLFVILISSCYFSVLAYATPAIYLTIALLLEYITAARRRVRLTPRAQLA